jgi:chromosome partitioning protein
MLDQTYKPLEAARMLGISKDRLLDLEGSGTIPDAGRDQKGNRFYTIEDIRRLRPAIGVRPPLHVRPTVIAVFNMKGGVGKSTVSANTAWKIAEEGFLTLAIDADPQGHMTTGLGEEPADFDTTLLDMLIPDLHRNTAQIEDVSQAITPNLDLVPANLSMCRLNLLLFQQPEREYRLRRTVELLRADAYYDLVIIDSPPSYDLTSLNILLACDFLIAPVKLDGNSFYGLQYLFDTIRDLSTTYRYQIPTVLIVSNHYNQSYSVSNQILDGLREHYAPYLADTVIRQDVSFDKANALREPVFITAPSSKGARDMLSLTSELKDILARTRQAETTTYEQKQA